MGLSVIRQATHDDVTRIVALGAEFHAYSPWRDVPYDLEAVSQVAHNAVENGVVYLSETGMCGGIVSGLYFSPEFKIGLELFWWAPNDGQALRAAYEDWCRERGASAVQFSALGDEHLPAVTRIYRRAGFDLGEAVFVKRF
jgi:hypothetical protein